MPETKTAERSELTAENPGLHELAQEEELHVFDLPQVHNRPTASVLLSALADLSSEPPSWDTIPRSDTSRNPLGSAVPLSRSRRRKVKSEGVPSYLTTIVSSSLAWIEDDELKEQVWEAASQRLSERSGRSGMGAMSRTFVIPLQAAGTDSSVELTLHEPALTGDSLGLKTWASSFLLAKRICILKSGLPRLPKNATVLELGSGTGLVGLAAAAVLQAHVILTDLPEITPNLEHNAHANTEVLAACGASVDVAVLDWSKPDDFGLQGNDRASSHSFSLIFVADPLYDTEHPMLLVKAIDFHLTRDHNARVVVELPLREGYKSERSDFRNRMNTLGLVISSDGEDTGFDDWSSTSDDQPSEVRCWWSIWRWR